MELPGRHILTGSISEFVFFCEQTETRPASLIPILQRKDVERIPLNATVILYGTYHKHKLYPLIQEAWEANFISTKVILPDEITT